jgi:hypothetical protein
MTQPVGPAPLGLLPSNLPHPLGSVLVHEPISYRFEDSRRKMAVVETTGSARQLPDVGRREAMARLTECRWAAN